jgi:acetoin utilization deacetylase AcuC-like enzyme
MSFVTVSLYHNLEEMTDHIPPGGEPEEPFRIVAIEAVLKGQNPLVYREKSYKDMEIPIKPGSLWWSCNSYKVNRLLPTSKITEECGRQAVLHAEKNTPSPGEPPQYDEECGDIYWSSGTWRATRVAAAAAIQATQDALRAEDDFRAFCIVRPPGHHCYQMPTGFCYLNNVVFAAREVLNAGKRVAIIDWDYHFGDGTASALWNDRNAMFVSFHAAKTHYGRETYPARDVRNFKGKGLLEATHGRSWNVEWTEDTAGDAEYAYAFREVLIPALHRFNPHVILISAGYDAVKGDSLAGMNLTPAAFGYMSSALTHLGCPVVCILEGGYNPLLLADSVAETIRGLKDDPKYANWITSKPVSYHKQVVDRLKEDLNYGFRSDEWGLKKLRVEPKDPLNPIRPSESPNLNAV